jgi:hypothetical protein
MMGENDICPTADCYLLVCDDARVALRWGPRNRDEWSSSCWEVVLVALVVSEQCCFVLLESGCCSFVRCPCIFV